MKRQIIDLLKSTEREGIENLIDWMDNNGFFEAPCSTQFHLAQPRGLAEHSLNVYKMAISLYENNETFNSMTYNEIIIATLLHDLGKAGQFGKPNYVENYLKSGELSKSKPYETNKNLIPVPHEIRSIQIASQFIELTEDESYAILMHNGMYGDLKYQLNGKETPLQMLLHFSDLWCSRVTEVAENDK